VKHYLLKIVFVMIFVCLAFGLAQTALAAETFVTTDSVNIRSGPSLDAERIGGVYAGASLSVLEHDPAGWSMVSFDGKTGYIRSDFLKFPIGSTPATFRATDVVRFRTGPSTDASVIKSIEHGTSVDVLEHNPAGWSKVRISSSTGYIRSDFLTRDITQSAAATSVTQSPTAASSSSSSTTTLWTTGTVNFRTGPSTDSSKISTLATGTAVGVLEQGSNGWSKCSVGGSVGYIKSDLLSTSNGRVEYLDWSEARNLVKNGVPIRVVDVRTGLTYTIQSFSKSGHADVEPLTAADTDTILRSRNGEWKWDPRPVWVTLGDRTIAASLNGMPHAGSTISGNNMNGHLCLHFGSTVTNNKSYQQDLRNAVAEAYRASQ